MTFLKTIRAAMLNGLVHPASIQIRFYLLFWLNMPGRPIQILVSAGEASGDMYAAELVAAIRKRLPEAHFFGCAGDKMRAAGVEAVMDASVLGVVGLVEVIGHIPGIYGEFRKLIAVARERKPDLAILTDSHGFHSHVARKLHAAGIPVIQLIAPQAWAWRKGRVVGMRRDLAGLLCIYPFEEAFFRGHGIDAHYVGNPLPGLVRLGLSDAEFFGSHGLDPAKPLLTLLPGSRKGEIARHLPVLAETVRRLVTQVAAQFVLALPAGSRGRHGAATFEEPISGLSIQVIEGQTWDAMARSRLLLAASGTVTTEAAILGIPMVTYYRFAPATYHLLRHMVETPHGTMVSLIAGRRVVPELIQNEMNPERLANEAVRLWNDGPARREMETALGEVRAKLAAVERPMERAADLVMDVLKIDVLKK